MNDTDLFHLASHVAAELSKRDGQPWTAVPGRGDRGFGTDIRSEAGDLVNFQEARQLGRLHIEGMDPLSANATQESITVAADRPSDAIAAEVARRLLPGLREQLAGRREKEAVRAAAYRARAEVVNAAERLFGEATDFGELEPGATGATTYKTEARLSLRGQSARPSGYPVYQVARVETTDAGDILDLTVQGVPAPVVHLMLRVLASYASLREGGEGVTVLNATPDGAEFARLYNAYLFGRVDVTDAEQAETWEGFVGETRRRARAV